jgi:hypothetical protein
VNLVRMNFIAKMELQYCGVSQCTVPVSVTISSSRQACPFFQPSVGTAVGGGFTVMSAVCFPTLSWAPRDSSGTPWQSGCSAQIFRLTHQVTSSGTPAPLCKLKVASVYFVPESAQMQIACV